MNRTLESPEVQWRMDLERRASEAEEAARARRFLRYAQAQSQEPKQLTGYSHLSVALACFAVAALLIILAWSEYSGW